MVLALSNIVALKSLVVFSTYCRFVKVQPLRFPGWYVRFKNLLI
jgi:hypothetical protein